ncbi:hypothetical protein GQ42DRAFT_35846 [Ramicandelaber brevisporus]|nr:hypothetical protein GQ42DRAFT_35846 [Ramicandelaber brevisporus]
MAALFQPVWKKLERLQLFSVEESLSLEALVKSVPNATDVDLAYIPSTNNSGYYGHIPPPPTPCDIFILIAKLPRLMNLSINTRGIRAVCTPPLNVNNKRYNHIPAVYSSAYLLASSRIKVITLTGFEYMTSTAFAVIFSLPAIYKVHLKGSYPNSPDIRDITSGMRSVAQVIMIEAKDSSQQTEMTNISNSMRSKRSYSKW